MRSPTLHNNPPPGWEDKALQDKSYFNSSEWLNILISSFNTSAYYFWSEEDQSGFYTLVFKKGPFRIGYIGFPIYVPLGEVSLSDDLLNRMVSAWPMSERPDMLRVTATAIPKYTLKLNRLPIIRLPETTITDLPNWTLKSQRKMHRNVKKSVKSGVEIVELSNEEKFVELYDLYKETIIRNNGSLRYNLEYFKRLSRASLNSSRIKILLANIEERVAGFLVIALCSETVFYLHGGCGSSLRTRGGMSILFNEAISWAQSQESKSFNCLSSPINQPSLVQFKEKLGGTTYDQLCYDYPIKRLKCITIKAANYIILHISKLLNLLASKDK